MFASAARPVWWLPTVGFFLFFFLVAGMFLGKERIFEDPAVGRHLRTAEFILETGRVPRVDPLSFTAAGQPWCDYEWGFEATLGELDRAGGLPLIEAFCFALFGATVLGVYRTLLQSGFSVGVVILYTGLAYLTLHMHFSVRPLLFTYLFLALTVEVWFRRSHPLKRDWLLLPLVFAAWANLHAGWAAALVFLVMALAGRCIDRVIHRVSGDEAPLIPWLGLTALCTLATWLNPWGWTLHRHIFEFSTSYKSFALWDEYAPPNFSGPSMSALTVLFILGVLLVARLTPRAPTWRWENMLPLLFFLYEGLKTQRHVLLLVIVVSVPVARDLQAVMSATWWPFRERLALFQEKQRTGQADAWMAALAAIILTVFFLHAPIAQKIEVGASVTPRLMTFLRQHPDRFTRPLVTTWNAGPLLWNMRPDFRVSFDDRGDFYGDKTVFSFVDLYNGVPGWRDTLNKGGYDSAILDPYLPLNQLLHLIPGWREVYRDDHAVIYWKEAK